jgi:hypothetical protein
MMTTVLPQATAQDLATERSKVLRVLGQTKAVSLPLFPIADTVGLVFQQEIIEPGAEGLRIHFAITRSGEAWGVQVKDAAGEVAWSTWDSGAAGDDFWSDEIDGDKLTVEVHSSRPSNLLQLTIDKIAVIKPEVTPVSITGVNQLTSIIGQDDWIVDLGGSVARLRFVGDDGRVYVCTAFLVTSDLMLTNQHCIASQSEMDSALVDFDYLEEGVIGRTLRLSELLETDHTLDYSVVRLSQCVGRTPLELETTHPADDEQLLIIQHPAGEPKQVSIADCTVDGPLVEGRGATDTDMGHQCDTKGGSSGSPVFQFSSQRVVALHHLGINPASGNLFNRAAHIDLILDDMDPAVRAEIEEGQW